MMEVKTNEQGDVKWQWVKKRFSKEQASIKLLGIGYTHIDDEDNYKILAFKRPIFEGEDLPDGVVPVTESYELSLLDVKDDKPRQNNPAPRPETLTAFKEQLIKKGLDV